MANTPLIIAHRGESFLAPENSLSAINLAWENKVKAVEIDIRLSLDNQIVVIHDKDTGRVGNTKYSVPKSSLKHLKTVDIGSKKEAIFKGEKIPTLEEVMHTMPNDGKLIIEIKCGVEIITPLIKVLKHSHIPSHQIEIISFNINVLSALKKQISNYKMLWLLDLDYYWPSWLLKINAKTIKHKIMQHNLDGVNLWAGKILNTPFINEFKAQNLLVYTWTVDDLNKAKKLTCMGVDAITTNKAEWLSQHLEGTKQ